MTNTVTYQLPMATLKNFEEEYFKAVGEFRQTKPDDGSAYTRKEATLDTYEHIIKTLGLPINLARRWSW